MEQEEEEEEKEEEEKEEEEDGRDGGPLPTKTAGPWLGDRGVLMSNFFILGFYAMLSIGGGPPGD